ncbi:bifunctional oligoribonuclease/PAP phosphatase NrnA [Flavobacterium agricola]|uniref:Bifunctional oligoribonuclease/PAP phosphatase NrnA n=1 Tax=Flavobacterium agricola TaxID=2870839 RepID=A0ABY6M5G6_9FLAO|nr:bifunctional oligoribonuclease/PAP phosphatase NrnA [Flavobacterium agricola]UYW02618.1 bifunctional oligoribonuclease/PAP phosphatase NrnA [Flavobacterium agricola]
MQTNDYLNLKKQLTTTKKVVIIPHRNPDGDAMGSTLGLYFFLKKLNIDATVIAPNDFPEFLAWLPDANKTVIYENTPEKASKILDEAELIFTLDFNAFHRTGDVMGQKLATLQQPFVMIDHHELPDPYATYMYSDTSMSSTCEMVYHFISNLGYENMVDYNIATCLYTGIVTDTGSFRFPKTTSTTHRVVANLIDKGVESDFVFNNLYNNSTYARLQLLGKALQNLTLLPEYHASYITLTQDELNQFNFEKGDTEGIVNYGLQVKGINLTAIFIENKQEGIIKISFRSRGDVDVNAFARAHFNGGGHINAAGGKSVDNMEQTVKKFITILESTK